MKTENDGISVYTQDWLEQFGEALQSLGRGKRTVRAYLQDISQFARWFEAVNHENLRPDTLNSVDLRAWRRHSLEVEKISASTWNRRRASLRVVCDWARNLGYLSYDPLQGVEPARQAPLPPRWLERGELSRLYRSAELAVHGAQTDAWRWQALRDQAMICLMALAGLREGEVCALDLADVELSDRKGRVIIRQGKGDKRREIPLNAETRRAVSAWISGRGAWPGALFVGKRSERLTTRTVQRRISEIGRQAGLSLTPHALRHSFAKQALDAGAPLTVVSQLLGHSRLETTARYVQPGWADFERAVEAI